MPTDWESRYRAGDTPWERGEASPGLVDFLAASPLHGRVLVPGCGLGHDVRAISAAGGERVEAVGLDIAPSAVTAARALPRVGNERFEVGDLFNPPDEWLGAFDGVWEHTCFCAIDPELRERYVSSVARLLRPGGEFLAIFYLDPGLEPGESGPPFGVSPEELDRLFQGPFRLNRRWAPTRTYPGREGREEMRLYLREG